LFSGVTHAKWAGLFNGDFLWIRDVLSIIRAVDDDIAEVCIWKFCVKYVKCCVSCMENKGLAGISRGARNHIWRDRPLGTVGDSDNTVCDKLGPTSRHISVLRAFDMFLHYYVASVFSVWPIEIGTFRENGGARGKYFD